MSSKQTRNDEMVTNADIAEHFHVSLSTVRAWRHKLPPYIKKGSNLRWLADVEKVVKSWPSYNFGRKLTDEQVSKIWRQYEKGGITQRELAAEYGVHHSTISHILSGHRYGGIK